MNTLIRSVLADLQADDPEAVREALLMAAFVFEKARLPHHSETKQQRMGWSASVVSTAVTPADVAVLRDALTALAEQVPTSPYIGSVLFSLGKLQHPALAPVLQRVLRRLVAEDHPELYQAMIALQNQGEAPFGNRDTSSALEMEVNRALARAYLVEHHDPAS